VNYTILNPKTLATTVLWFFNRTVLRVYIYKLQDPHQILSIQ